MTKGTYWWSKEKKTENDVPESLTLVCKEAGMLMQTANEQYEFRAHRSIIRTRIFDI